MCKSYYYKGLIIYENDDSEFGTKYYSVANPKIRYDNGKNPHAHSTNRRAIYRIADCFNALKSKGYCRGYSLLERNKAMRLNGTFIKMMS